MKSVILSLNLHEIRSLYNLCRGLGVEFQPSLRVFPSLHPHRIPERFRLDTKGIETFLKIKNELPMKNWKEREPFAQDFICNAGREACCISATGRVYPCVALRWECGDLKKNGFAEIWERSLTLRKIRSYEEKDFKICYRCKWKASCNFCPGMGFSEYGNMLIPSKEICKFTKTSAS